MNAVQNNLNRQNENVNDVNVNAKNQNTLNVTNSLNNLQHVNNNHIDNNNNYNKNMVSDLYKYTVNRIVETKNSLSGVDLFFMFLIGILIVIVILSPFILVTVFGNRSRVMCLTGSNKNAKLANLTLTFIAISWIGGFIPLIGPMVHLVGMIGTIVLIVLSQKKCYK